MKYYAIHNMETPNSKARSQSSDLLVQYGIIKIADEFFFISPTFLIVYKQNFVAICGLRKKQNRYSGPCPIGKKTKCDGW